MNQKTTKIIQLKSDLRSDQSYLVTINNILTNKDLNIDIKKFVLHDYQRPYTWDGKLLKQLINDINNLKDGDSHFVGTIYLGNHDVSNYWPIIDGQQRIITFYILLHYLKKYCSFTKISNFNVTIKVNGEYVDLDSIFEKDPKFIDNLLLKEYCENINSNLKWIKKYFSENNIDKQHFANFLLEKVCFIVIVCLDHKMELDLFYDINSKHFELDDVDKIKAYLIKNIFKPIDMLDFFINSWSSLYKEGKESSYLFFKILFNSLTDRDYSGKFKYDDLVEIIDKKYIDNSNLSNFVLEYKDALKRFKIVPSDYNNLSIYKDSNYNQKNIVASLYLIKQLRQYRKFVQEITNKKRYEKYISGEHNPIIMFLLYILTFICEADFSFKNTDGQKKIGTYQTYDEKKRKEKLNDLWKKFKNGGFLDKIEYYKPKLNKDIPHIAEKSKCILPLLLIAESQYKNFYETIIKHLSCGKKELDHFIPIKWATPKHEIENVDYNDVKRDLCSIYNIQILSKNENRRKADSLNSKYYGQKLFDNLGQIDYSKIKEVIYKRKLELIDNLENVISKLLK